MQQQGLAPDVIAYKVLINACGQGKQLKEVLELLVSTCKKSKQPRLVLDLIEAIYKQGIMMAPKGITYIVKTLINVQTNEGLSWQDHLPERLSCIEEGYSKQLEQKRSKALHIL